MRPVVEKEEFLSPDPLSGCSGHPLPPNIIGIYRHARSSNTDHNSIESALLGAPSAGPPGCQLFDVLLPIQEGSPKIAALIAFTVD